jgi:hypothetical protein
MEQRFQVRLDEEESRLLARVAADELRDPREQLRYLLRQDLERRGLLPVERMTEAAGSGQQEADVDAGHR